MANQNTRAKIKLARKEKKHFHGQFCDTTFDGGKHSSPKRRRAWRGLTSEGKRR